MSKDLNKNQDNQHGGKREGAGRKEGSYKKPVISDFITEDEVKDLVELAKKTAKEKPEILKFLLEQVFGKPRQNIGLDGGEGEPIKIELSEMIHKKNDTSQDAKPSSRKQKQV